MCPYVYILGIKFALYDIFAFAGLVVQHFVFMYCVKKRGGLSICAREVQIISVFFRCCRYEAALCIDEI